jgi:ABC-type uncharacterized transport system ATPase component
VRKGEFVCVIGDVGSGKSSLFNAINGDMIFVPEDVILTATDKKKDQEYFTSLTN